MRQRGRFAGFFLYVSNTTYRHSGYLCYKDGPELPPLDFNTNCITHGRYIIFYNERIPGTIYLLGYETSTVFTELCEVSDRYFINIFYWFTHFKIHIKEFYILFTFDIVLLFALITL